MQPVRDTQPALRTAGASTDRRVLVVVPAWNEQASVSRVVSSVRDLGLDVLVVDDGSGDATSQQAAAAGAAVCRLPFNLGVGGAMRAGYRYALRERYDAVVQVDADGQHDPAYIPRMVAELDRADIVVGARFAGEGDYLARGPRRWAMRLLAIVLSWIAHTELSDVTSGFRAVNRRGLELFASHYPAEYLGDTVESLVIAARAGCSISQVPVGMRARTTGRASQSPLRATLYLSRAVVALTLALMRRWPTAFETLPREAS